MNIKFIYAACGVFLLVIVELADTIVACNTVQVPLPSSASSSSTVNAAAPKLKGMIDAASTALCNVGDPGHIVAADVALLVLYVCSILAYVTISLCRSSNGRCRCCYPRISDSAEPNLATGKLDFALECLITLFAFIICFVSISSYKTYIAGSAVFALVSVVCAGVSIAMFSYIMVILNKFFTICGVTRAKRQQVSTFEVADAESNGAEAAATIPPQSEVKVRATPKSS